MAGSDMTARAIPKVGCLVFDGVGVGQRQGVLKMMELARAGNGTLMAF
jgi:hypothetical protein